MLLSGELNHRPRGSIPDSGLLRAWNDKTRRDGELLHTWSFESRQFAEFLREKGGHLWRLSKTLQLQVNYMVLQMSIFSKLQFH